MSLRTSLAIARMEFLSHLLSARFALMVVLCVALVATSVSVLVIRFRQLQTEFPIREKQHRDEVDGYGSTWEFMSRGCKVEKRPHLLGVFGEGASGRLGRTLQVPSGSYGTASPLRGNPLFRAFETLDLVFVIKVILSLAALLVVHDVICGEKTRGTLKLLLCNPVGRDQVLIGKLLGAMAGLLIPLVLSFAVGGLMLLHMERSAVTAVVWQSLGLALAAAWLYVLTFLTLGLMVSSATTHPDSSLLWLLFCWVMFVFALPSAGVFATEALYRVRPPEEVHGQTRAAWANVRHRWSVVYAKRRSLWRHLPYKEQREKMLREWDGIMNDARSAVAKVHEARRQELMGQMRFARMLSWLSPASCFESVTTAFLGTDYESHVRFMDVGRAYGEDLQRFLRQSFRENMALDEMKRRVKSWRRFAAPGEEAVQDKLARIWPELLVLAILNVAFFMLAHGLFMRYDPT